jgi:cyclophilin family peptidyl-prolyl cis-trans isomerase
MPNKRTRQRQLQRVADRRAAERRRQRRNRIIVWITAGAVFLGGGAFAVVAFLGGDGESARPEAGPSPTPTETSESPEETGDVACDAEVPKLAGEEKPQYDKAPDMQIDESAVYTARLQTSCGEVEIELLAKDAPLTVNNFVFLAREGFYDGLTFHRVIPGFMAQGGDPLGTGTGGPGYQFEDEFVDSLVFDSPGILAMANSGPATNGSQFFITVAPTEHLNGAHTIFGRVTSGTDVMTEIESYGTPEGAPTSPVYIEKVTIDGP